MKIKLIDYRQSLTVYIASYMRYLNNYTIEQVTELNSGVNDIICWLEDEVS